MLALEVAANLPAAKRNALVVVVLTLTLIATTQSVVTGQAPKSLKWKTTSSIKSRQKIQYTQ